MKNNNYKSILSIIGLVAIFSCSQIFNKSAKSDGTETGFLAARFQNLNIVRLTVSGKAQLTGTIKNAKVQARTIPREGDDAGKCDGNAGILLANGLTSGGSEDKNDGGYYSLKMEKPSESTICLVITPTPESTAYSPFQKKPIPWRPKADQGTTGANAIRVSSVLLLSDANSVTSRELSTSGNVNPLTNMASAKFAYAIKKQIQMSIRSRSVGNNSINYAMLSDTDLAAMVNNANEEIGQMFFGSSGKKIDPSKVNFGDPTAPGFDPGLAKQFSSVLGGIDSIINKLINGRGLNASESEDISTLFDSFLDIISGDIAGDGVLNGQGIVDESGSPITLPPDLTTVMSDPAGSLSEGMVTYVNEIAASSGNDGSGIVWTPSDVNNPSFTGGGITSNLPAPTLLSYSGSPYIYFIGIPITSLSPTVTGTVTSYSILPALPAGLSLNTITGVISGTPTTAQAVKTYTISATNSGGSTTATISITIKIPAPSSLTYGGNNYTYTTGMAITSITPSVTGTVNSYTISPALPAGLTLNSTTGIISGTPTATQGPIIHTVTATNATGTTTANITLTVNALAVSYIGTPFIFANGATITTKNITINGTATSYGISSSLPSGLFFNTSTGSISGTPSSVSGSTPYTITAYALSGVTATTNINITVYQPITISYAGGPYTYNVGSAISSLTPIVTNGPATGYSISPSLSAGLIFNTSTGVISGNPSATMSITTYTISATSASNGNTTTTISITVNPIPAPSGLSYANNNPTYYQNVPVSNSATVTGTGITFTISPDLPNNLSINPSTGLISGTPITTISSTPYTVTATNSSGSTNVVLNITISVVSSGCSVSATYSYQIATDLWLCAVNNLSTKTWTDVYSACNNAGNFYLATVSSMTRRGLPTDGQIGPAMTSASGPGFQYVVTGQPTRACYWDRNLSAYEICNGLGYIATSETTGAGPNWVALVDGNSAELRTWPSANTTSGATLISLCQNAGADVSAYIYDSRWR